MAATGTDLVDAFHTSTEEVHARFLDMWTNNNCTNCPSSSLADAVLTAWIQTEWAEFSRRLLSASASGFQRPDGSRVESIPTVKDSAEATKAVNNAATQVRDKRNLCSPVWHASWFVLDVATILSIRNLRRLEETVCATPIPEQMNVLRNVLIHPGDKNQYRYETLQAKLGMLGVAPELLTRQLYTPGVPLFTYWIRELQRVADGSVQ